MIEDWKPWGEVDLTSIPSATDPDVLMAEHDSERNCITLRWSYEYDIDLDTIQRPEDLLWWIHHVGKKAWRCMTPGRIAGLIELVAKIKGWPPYKRAPHEHEAPAPKEHVAAERAKVTSHLRYAVIMRDGYRCRACGFAVEDGAHLHVDHIIPVSKGGLTERGNLQTLCTACNLGKANK